MGAFGVKLSNEAILESISSWCDDQGFTIAREEKSKKAGEASVGLEATPLCDRVIRTVLWDVRTRKDRSLVRMEVELNRLLVTCSAALICVLIGVGLGALYFLPSLSESAFLILVPGCLLLGLACRLMANWLVEAKVSLESSFWTRIPKGELIRNVERRHLPLWLLWPVVIFANVFLLPLFLLNNALLLGLWIICLLCCFGLVGLLDVLVVDAYSRWKMLTAHVTDRWMDACLMAVVPVVMLCCWNSMIMLDLEGAIPREERPGVTIQKVFRGAFSGRAFRRETHDFEGENVLMFGTLMARKTERVRAQGISGATVRRNFRAACALMLIMMLVLWICYLRTLRRLLSCASEWGMHTGYGRTPQKLIPSAVPLHLGERRRALRVVIFAHFLVGSVVTLTTGVIMFEAFVYVLLKDTLVVRPLAHVRHLEGGC